MARRPEGDCPACRHRYWTTADGRMWRHEILRPGGRRYVWCDGSGQPAKPLARTRPTATTDPEESTR